jgi:ubiquinone/menaquinone biosynthesis C-methylase UbiE
MNFYTFFSNQARRPNGWFGRNIMRLVFDQGNAFLNDFAYELMSIQTDDRIIEIGFGTGKLIARMARKIDKGLIEGIDFSRAMVSIAQKRNKGNIAKGKVKIYEGDFNSVTYKKQWFSKACSVNTLYFWPSPVSTLKKIAGILKSGGKLILAFEDMEQLIKRKLDHDVFHIYSTDEIRDLFIHAGFSNGTRIVSRERGKLMFHCAVAET